MSYNHISSCVDWLAFAAFHAGGDAEDMRRHSLDHRSYGNGAAPPRARDNKQSGHEHYHDTQQCMRQLITLLLINAH